MLRVNLETILTVSLASDKYSMQRALLVKQVGSYVGWLPVLSVHFSTVPYISVRTLAALVYILTVHSPEDTEVIGVFEALLTAPHLTALLTIQSYTVLPS